MYNSHSEPRLSGRLAPRLIQDILSGRLDDSQEGNLEAEFSPLFLPCQQLRQPPVHLGASAYSIARGAHDLLVKPPQTQENGPFEPSSVSCICVLCRHHFIFNVTPGHQPLGRTEQDGHLLHHYIRTKAEHFENQGVENSPTFKRYPLIARAEYECSVCSHHVSIEMMAPRFPSKWIDLVTDEERIKNKIADAKKTDPERYDSIRESLQTGALITLNAYLRNLTANGATEPKRILFRNKIYHLQFGDDAKPLFSYLDFTYSQNGDGDEAWLIPVLEPQSKTPLHSSRAFYEDVRSEIQSVIAGCGEILQNTGIQVDNLPARPVLDRILECGDNKYRHSIGADPSDVIEHFDTLGTTRDSDPPLLQWAYACQVRVDPARQKIYLHALESLFKSGKTSRKTEPLETYLTTELSKQSLPVVSTPLAMAYQYFNLRADCFESDSYILAVYKTFVEQSPSQKHKHRLMLQQIGTGRNSQEILRMVYNEPMSVKEAYELLSADKSYVMSGIAVMAQQEIQNGKTDPNLVLMALETIAQDRPASGPDDVERHEFEQIMASIRAKVTGDGRAAAQTPVSDLDLPVGLENLRNTCYLNSILQYFFSVNAVRELALRCSNQPSLPSTQEGVSNALQQLGLVNLPPGRAFLASHFAHELGTLFKDLQTSPSACVRPRQRLANAALMRSFQVRSTPEDKLAADGSASPSKDAPPLPPRANNSSNMMIAKVSINAVSDVSETASDVSSQTLVNQPDDERSYVVIDRQTDKAEGRLSGVEISEGTDVNPTRQDAASDSDLTVEELARELDQPNVGSDQMDIDEVMGNMIDLLEAAEEVSRAMTPESIEGNSIRKSFFSANVDHRKNTGGTWSTNNKSDRWAVAYPAAKGARELYDALEPTFGLEQTDTERLLYVTIEEPAPNFHVYIQRTSLISKNLNSVRIPDTLYLDRYMETDKESALFSRRRRGWNINARLAQIEEQLGSTTSLTNLIVIPDLDNDLLPTEDGVDGWNMVDISQADDLSAAYGQPKVQVTPVEARTTAQPIGQVGSNEINGVETEADLLGEKHRLLEERNGLFADMCRVKYRLHAVLCHIGTSGRAGHYWAWVHDFEQGVWRKYNDTTVTVDDSQHVLQQLNTTDKGEPYYIAYVRDSDVDELVRIPRREVRVTQEESSQDPVRSVPEMGKAEGSHPVVVERIEDVDMAPPSYQS